MRLGRATLTRNAIAAALGLGASLGNDCHHSPSPECDACDAVKLLETVASTPDFPWAIPAAAAEACRTRGPLHEDIRKLWEKGFCPELTALYAVEQWSSYSERFDDDVRGGVLCPSEYTASAGCACAPSTPDDAEDEGGDPYPSIIGPYEGNPVHMMGLETTSGTDSTTTNATGMDATGMDATDTDATDTDATGTTIASGGSGETDTGGTEGPTSSEGDGDGTDTGPNPDCPDPSLDLVYWGRAVGFLLPDDWRAGFRPDALATGPFRGEQCGDRVFETDGCTVSLIGPRHVLTARHCLVGVDLADCEAGPVAFEDHVVLFDYNRTPLTAKEVVVERVVACGPNAARHERGDEWTVLELAEPITDRCPLALPHLDRAPRLCEPVYALGHPLGHELFRVGSERDKSPTAWVTSPAGREVENGAPEFYTTIDTMDSMSGAPIFAMDGQLIGINVSGAYSLTKFVDEPGSCTIQICPPTGCLDEYDYPAAVSLAVTSDRLQGYIDAP